MKKGEKMSQEGRDKIRERMIKDNPMKKLSIRIKSSKSHKGNLAWNKGLTSEEYKRHYPNGIKGGRVKGYKHSEESKEKMSKIRSQMLKEGKIKLGKLSPIELEKSRERMRKNRQNLEFNQKMFFSFTRSITKPHLKIKEILHNEGIKSTTNLTILFGRIFGSVDEAIEDKKVAIYIDGNYWHKYPAGRRWDKYCTTFLQNRGWKVIRLWESEINSDIEKCRQIIINAIKS